MWKVTLKRGPKGDRTWEHDLKWTAIRRARCLAELHSTDYKVDPKSNHIIVDASNWYGG